MNENEIKAIVFDAGGVLLDLDLERCKSAFKEKLEYNRIDELLDACHQKGIYGDMEEGKISADEFRAVLDSIGLEPGEVLYIDDSPSNAAAASGVGMHGLHYRVGSDLEELVESAIPRVSRETGQN